MSEDGVEMTFAPNSLGHFLLTRLLLDKMAETARDTGIEGRIVNVSSTIHSWFPGDDDALGYLDRVTRRKMCVICCALPSPPSSEAVYEIISSD